MAPAEEKAKDEYELARNYGLDITMPVVNLAISSAAQRTYQKKCNVLYREFQKNMNMHMKIEQALKADLRKMRKEKLTNRQYSLYRTAGADLFSKADETRRLIMKHNLTTTSPLMEYFDFNPWGLDAIVDEDLIRPDTAPPEGEDAMGMEDTLNESLRPKTAEAFGEHHVMSEQNKQNNQTLASTLEARFAEPGVAKVEHLLQSQSAYGPQQTVRDTNQPETIIDHADDETSADGEVDVNTERTRARKITLKSEKFSCLQTGEVSVKLRDKDGKFILKPVNRDFVPDSVESVFVAKDPSKEKMALVRRSTSVKSPTVASALKVNNRIAIQKSLMGKASKKTSVAEIFKEARERKTRHFRIFLKHPGDMAESGTPGETPGVTNTSATSPTVGLYKHQKKMTTQNRSETASAKVIPTIRTNSESSYKGSKLIAYGERPLGSTSGKQSHISVAITAKPKGADLSPTTAPSASPIHAAGGGLLVRRRCDSSASSVIRPPSQLSMGNNEVFNASGHHRVMFAKCPNPDQPDSREQTPLNRSVSSMSMRDSTVQFKFSDKDMTDMIQKLVEGKGGEIDRSDRPVSNLSIGGTFRTLQMVKKFSGIIQRKRSTPTPSNISAETETTVRSMSRLRTSRDTQEIIRNIRKKDEEYEEAMTSMRRRVALGASGSRRPTTSLR